MLIRRENTGDAEAVRLVTFAAFADPEQPDLVPVEARLVDELRADTAVWLPELSLVAEDEQGDVAGHVLCTRGWVQGRPVLALGPLSVRPDRQRRGFGSALTHAVLGGADALGEPLVGLLGDPAYYGRFGFRLAAQVGIDPPVPEWAPHFQVRVLYGYDPGLIGTFTYADPFNRL